MDIWRVIEETFRGHPAKMRVVKYLFIHGLGITESGEIRCGKIEIPYNKIARALDVHPITISQTIKIILQNPRLRMVFLNLEPTLNLIKSGKYLGYNTLKINLRDKDVHAIPNLISKVTAEYTGIVQLIIYPALHGGLDMVVISKGDHNPVGSPWKLKPHIHNKIIKSKS